MTIPVTGVRGFQRVQTEEFGAGFLEGREFRVTRKIRLAAGQEIVYKNIIDVDIIIKLFAFDVTKGNYEVDVWAPDSVTEVSAFTATVPFGPKNSSAEHGLYNGSPYQTQMQIFSSGAVSIGSGITINLGEDENYIDYLELNSSGNGNNAGGVSGGVSSFRYAPSPVTFYTRITNLGTGEVRGIINNEWEERPVEVQRESAVTFWPEWWGN